MVLLAIDVDAPGHGEKPTTDEARAELAARREAWWQGEQSKLAALVAAHPGALRYRSRSGGYRLVWRLASPFAVDSEAAKVAWQTRYRRTLCYLARRFDIEGDPACGDVGRLYRLPTVVQTAGSTPTTADLRGDPTAIGTWHHEPGESDLAADLAAARRLAEKHTAWETVAKALGPRVAPPQPAASRARTSSVGLDARERAELWLRAVPGAFEGQGGSTSTLKACSGLTVGFLLSVDDALSMIERIHNPLCLPQWSHEELRHKVSDAAKNERGLPRGWLLNAEKPRSKRQERQEKAREKAAEVAATAPPLLSVDEAAEQVESALAAALASPGVVLARADTGTGKSRALCRILSSRNEAARIAEATHKLAAQTAAGLPEHIKVSAPAGPLSVRKLPMYAENPRAICPREVELEPLRAAGVDLRRRICSSCKHRESHKESGEKCLAFATGHHNPDALIWVMQSAGIERTLEEMIAALRDKKPGAPRILAIDEPPSMFLRVPLPAALAAYDRSRDALTAVAFEAIGPVMPLLESLRRDARLSLADVLRARDDAAFILRDLRDFPGDVITLAALASLTSGAGELESVKQKAEDVATLRQLVAVLRSAAKWPDFAVVDPDGEGALVARASWVDLACEAASPALGASVVIMDATANETAWRVVCPEIRVVTIEAADGPGVERVFLDRGNCAAKHLVGEGQWKNVRGLLRDLAAVVMSRGRRKVVIFTFMALAETLDTAIKAVDETKLPAEFVAMLRAGVHVETAYYFGNRGLNTWEGFDAYFTLGDARMNIGVSHAEAAALGLDPDEYAEAQGAAESTQTWGRSRAVRRVDPVLICHIGGVAPPGRQWAGVMPQPATMGRPPKLTAEDVANAPGETVAAKARALGVARNTIKRAMGWGGQQVQEKKIAERETPENPLDVLVDHPTTHPTDEPATASLVASMTPAAAPLMAEPASGPEVAGNDVAPASGLVFVGVIHARLASFSSAGVGSVSHRPIVSGLVVRGIDSLARYEGDSMLRRAVAVLVEALHFLASRPAALPPVVPLAALGGRVGPWASVA
jgi:hypothetical protein